MRFLHFFAIALILAGAFVLWSLQRGSIRAPLATPWSEIVQRDLPYDQELDRRLDQSKRLRSLLDYALTAYSASSIDGHMYEESAKLYIRLAASPTIKTICEVGLNGGHSALNWLVANPDAHLYEFELGADDHRYYKIGHAMVEAVFPDRMTLILGDSDTTLSKFHADHPDLRCDLISIDGGHVGFQAFHDVANFLPLAHSATIAVMDDCAADHDQERVGRVAREAVEEGILVNLEKFKHFPDVGPRGSCVAQYNIDAVVPANWWRREWHF